jgi:hypothetical protein
MSVFSGRVNSPRMLVRIFDWRKSRSLEFANYAKIGEQSVFSEIHTIHAFGTPQGTLIWTRKRGMWQLIMVNRVVADRQTHRTTTVLPFWRMRAEG